MEYKKSQVTLFMIMALLIVAAGAIYFFYQKESAQVQEYVAPEVQPVKIYMDNCVKGISEDGLERIGLSGGFIKIPPRIDEDPRAYISELPQSGFKMPYWWHKGIEAIPPENFIKEQLKNFIKNELAGCVNNFEPFLNQFEIKQLKEPEIEVIFNDEDTRIDVNYPLEISSKDNSFTTTIENFGSTLPIRFKRVYELARLIMERENNDYFLEKRTIDLMSMDSEIPITDLEVTCSPKTWHLSDIKNKLGTLLRINLPYIRVEGTDYNANSYVPNPNGRDIYSQTYFQHHYIMKVAQNPGNRFKNMKVAFKYEDWPMEIYARPSQNGLLKSNAEKGTEMLKFFCMHLWHFTYDLRYPVVVAILDQGAAGNDQYLFNFAFQVDIDHNMPNRANKGTTLFEEADEITSEEYCSDVEKDITIFTVNNATGEDLKDVNLTFACGRFYCDLGKSEWLSLGAAAGISKTMPYCVYGVLKGAKEGFEDSQSFIQTDADGKSYLLFMNPIKEFNNYRVVKHLISNPSVEEELSGNEKASIFIKGNETGFEEFAFYPRETDYPLRIPKGKDSKYDIAVYLIDGEELLGGYIGQWKISKDEIETSNEIVFHVIYQGSATEDERAMFAAGLDSYSKKVPQPELK